MYKSAMGDIHTLTINPDTGIYTPPTFSLQTENSCVPKAAKT